jgi:hypothetical protein
MRTPVPLQRWLERIGARAISDGHISNGATTVILYNVTAKHTSMTQGTRAGEVRVFVVFLYSVGGWDLFVPAHNGNDIVQTLDGAALAMGVDGCAGLT